MAISTKDLQYGDVLITVPSQLISHCGVVAGTREKKTGSNSSVQRSDMIVHATTGGIQKTDSEAWMTGPGNGSVFTGYGPTDVFRCRQLRYCSTGGTSAGQNVAKAADQLMAKCQYGKGRAAFKSWSGTSTYGSGAEARLKKYLSRLGAGATHITDLYCSELVVLSFQIAAQGDDTAPYFIALDGKHTLPKDLRNWLLQRTQVGGTWQAMGEMG